MSGANEKFEVLLRESEQEGVLVRKAVMRVLISPGAYLEMALNQAQTMNLCAALQQIGERLLQVDLDSIPVAVPVLEARVH